MKGPQNGPCVRLSERKRVPVPARGWRPDLARFRRKSRGRKEKSRINDGVASVPPVGSTSARSAGSCGGFAGIGNGVKLRAVISSLRSLSPKAYCHKAKKQGSTPGKENIMSQKRKISPLPLTGEKGHPGAPVSGGREPEHHCLHRTGGGLLPGLS